MFYIVLVIVLVWCIWLTYTRRQQVGGAMPINNSRELTFEEKIQVWAICLLNPVWGGAVMYYGWRSPLPVMARQANTISIVAFCIEFVVYFAFVFLTAHQ